MIYDKINKIINNLPYEIRDCLYIGISEKDSIKFKKEINKIIKVEYCKNGEISFPMVFKGIPVVIHPYYDISTHVIFDIEHVRKVYLYEYNNVKLYLDKLENLCKEYNMELGGCGCCGSPFINNLHTIFVDDINFENEKLSYSIKIREHYKDLLKEGK